MQIKPTSTYPISLGRGGWEARMAEGLAGGTQPILKTHQITNADKGRIPSSLGEAAEEHMAEGLEGDTQSMAESLEVQFGRLREEMLVYGFRCARCADISVQ
eukprot:1139015-Pelagomonas_calceolata.AAC.6